MIYSITGRCQPTGLQFNQTELEPIGIRSESTAWGVFVDSLNGPARCRLREKEDCFDNQGLHLVFSMLHPDRWLTTFRLNALMERKRGREENAKQDADSVRDSLSKSSQAGLFDALQRCEMSVLDASKALVGYDLVNFSATIEISDSGFKRFVQGILDELSAELKPRETDETVREKQNRIQERRRTLFRRLGEELVPRLAELQARLLLIDEMRYHWQEKSSPMHAWFRNLLNDPQADTPMIDITRGEDGNKSDLFGLEKPWYFNRKILELGENPYYMTRREDGDMEAGQARRPDHDDMSFNWMSTLLSRPDRWPPRKAGAISSQYEKWTASLADSSKAKSDFTRGILDRASIPPLRITPTPSLAYARVWALPHEQYKSRLIGYFSSDQGEATEQTKPSYQRVDEVEKRAVAIPFKCEGGILIPTLTPDFEVRQKPDMARIYAIMSEYSGLKEAEVSKRFDHRSRPVAAIHMPDRFMRVRLVRRETDTNWAEVRIEFTTTPNEASTGVLACATRVLAKRGFRIESVHIRYKKIDTAEEAGEVVLLVQASNEAGVNQLDTTPSIENLRHALIDELEDQLKHRALIKKDWVTVLVGMP